MITTTAPTFSQLSPDVLLAIGVLRFVAGGMAIFQVRNVSIATFLERLCSSHDAVGTPPQVISVLFDTGSPYLELDSTSLDLRHLYLHSDKGIKVHNAAPRAEINFVLIPPKVPPTSICISQENLSF